MELSELCEIVHSMYNAMNAQEMFCSKSTSTIDRARAVLARINKGAETCELVDEMFTVMNAQEPFVCMEMPTIARARALLDRMKERAKARPSSDGDQKLKHAINEEYARQKYADPAPDPVAKFEIIAKTAETLGQLIIDTAGIIDGDRLGSEPTVALAVEILKDLAPHRNFFSVETRNRLIDIIEIIALELHHFNDHGKCNKNDYDIPEYFERLTEVVNTHVKISKSANDLCHHIGASCKDRLCCDHTYPGDTLRTLGQCREAYDCETKKRKKREVLLARRLAMTRRELLSLKQWRSGVDQMTDDLLRALQRQYRTSREAMSFSLGRFDQAINELNVSSDGSSSSSSSSSSSESE